MAFILLDCNVGNESISGFPIKFGYVSRNTWAYEEKEKYWFAPNSKISSANSLITLAQPEHKNKLSKDYPNISFNKLINRHFQGVFQRPVLLIIPVNVTNKECTKNDTLLGLEFYYPSHIGRNETIIVSTNTVFQDDLFDFTDNIMEGEIYG